MWVGRNLAVTLLPIRYFCREPLFALKWITLISVLAFSSLLPFEVTYVSANEALSFSFNLNMLMDDWLAIYIQPPVKDLKVDCNSTMRGGFRVSFSSEEIYMQQPASAVYLQPRSKGTYSILVSFTANFTWSATVGVYTFNREFYGRAMPVANTPSGYFVIFPKIEGGSEGNSSRSYKINIFLSSYEIASSDVFSIKLPTPVNMSLFILASAALTYVNVFLVVDLYFKSKIEGISKVRLILIGLSILASLLILHLFYGAISGGEAYA